MLRVSWKIAAGERADDQREGDLQELAPLRARHDGAEELAR